MGTGGQIFVCHIAHASCMGSGVSDSDHLKSCRPIKNDLSNISQPSLLENSYGNDSKNGAIGRKTVAIDQLQRFIDRFIKSRANRSTTMVVATVCITVTIEDLWQRFDNSCNRLIYCNGCSFKWNEYKPLQYQFKQRFIRLLQRFKLQIAIVIRNCRIDL